MIKNVTITNYLGESLVLELMRPEKSGFVIKSMEGIGPNKANINITESSILDGGTFNSARTTTRNIVISLAFLSNGIDSIETIRHKSYRYFPTKKEVTLRFETDNRISEISGVVETNEPAIFSNDSGCQISIICPNPFFHSVANGGRVTTVFSGIEPNFEFPFSNESLTEKLIEFSIIQNKTENVVIYKGDADVGITIQMHAIGEVFNPKIYNTTTREVMALDHDKIVAITGGGIDDGDDIYITTEKGMKNIWLLRNGILYNILNSMARGSSWFTLTKGNNFFAFTTDSGSSNLQFSIKNDVLYEGV